MKKRSIIISVVAVVLLIALLSGCGKTNDQLPISRDEAKEIAIQQLGVDSKAPSYAIVTPAGTKEDPYYVVEVLLNGVAYAYRIDSHTGDIRKLTINDQNVDINNLPTIPGNDNSTYIGIDAAKEIAFSDARVTESKVTKFDFELDFAYGKYLYDIEFNIGKQEYEYEILADSGEIFKKNVDRETKIEPSVDENSFIGVGRAKEIALAHAEVASENAVFEATSWEMKKGSPVYEVEFDVKNVEYDYDIHAVTGEIIKYSIDGAVVDNGDLKHITPERAKDIALKHAGVTEKDVRGYESELDFDRGRELYEIDFSVGRTEYEYEIDAETGEVIRAEKEFDD